jgi:hypothetical protein
MSAEVPLIIHTCMCVLFGVIWALAFAELLDHTHKSGNPVMSHVYILIMSFDKNS